MRVVDAPLTREQVQAAVRLHHRMNGWQNTDAALFQLAKISPAFDGPSCLLKAVAVNALYGTQIRAIVRMARHAQEVLGKRDPATSGPELVHDIADLPVRDDGTARLFLSFAAKFCHFFIDVRRFPIYDDAARFMLRLHLGDGYPGSKKEERYRKFCDAFERLGAVVNVEGPRDLDRYLWISGMYARWLKQRKKKNPLVNSELLRVFTAPDEDEERELHALLPPGFERPFLRSMHG